MPSATPAKETDASATPSVSRKLTTASGGAPTLAAHPPSARHETTTTEAAHGAATATGRAAPSANIAIPTTNCIGVAQVGTPSTTATSR